MSLNLNANTDTSAHLHTPHSRQVLGSIAQALAPARVAGTPDPDPPVGSQLAAWRRADGDWQVTLNVPGTEAEPSFFIKVVSQRRISGESEVLRQWRDHVARNGGST